jgi:predicted  nucleic acid-binding Zn-ribbon protein
VENLCNCKLAKKTETEKLLLFKVPDINQVASLLQGGQEGVEQLKLRICLQDAEIAQLTEDLRVARERGDYLEKALFENKEISQRVSHGFQVATERGDKLEKALVENNKMFQELSHKLSELRNDIEPAMQHLKSLQNVIALPIGQPEGEELDTKDLVADQVKAAAAGDKEEAKKIKVTHRIKILSLRRNGNVSP